MVFFSHTVSGAVRPKQRISLFKHIFLQAGLLGIAVR